MLLFSASCTLTLTLILSPRGFQLPTIHGGWCFSAVMFFLVRFQLLTLHAGWALSAVNYLQSLSSEFSAASLSLIRSNLVSLSSEVSLPFFRVLFLWVACLAPFAPLVRCLCSTLGSVSFCAIAGLLAPVLIELHLVSLSERAEYCLYIIAFDILRVVRCCHGQSYIIHKCQSITNNVANGLTMLIHRPSMDQHSAWSPLSTYPWMPKLHPCTIQGWPVTLPPPPFCLSIRGCQSYCAIHGLSMDGQSPCPHPL